MSEWHIDHIPVTSHGSTLTDVNAVGAQRGARLGVGDGLRPRGAAQLVHDLDLVGAGDGAARAVELAERAEHGRAHAPLARGGAAPRVVGPRLERRLDEVAGAVGHARPEEELAVLGRGGRARGQRGDGLDDGGLGRAQGDGAAPRVVALDGAGRGRGGGLQQVGEARGCGDGGREGGDGGEEGAHF